MDNGESIFRDYTRIEHLSDGFEEAVFRKIKTKKRQRTVAVSTFGALLFGGFLFISTSLFRPDPGTPLFTHGESAVREEVPLTDYATFAASDDSNNYVIEQVGNFEQTGTI